MSNTEIKNPVLIGLIAFLAGVGLGIWGLIREDCQGGPGCWHGSRFLEWTGGILIVGALYLWWKNTWGRDNK